MTGMRKLSSIRASLACLMMSVALAGCSSAEDYFSNVNPFSKKETPLPGERRSVVTADPSLAAPAGTVRALSIGGVVSMNDWLNPGGNASNAPGNVAIGSGTSSAWRAQGSGGEIKAAATPIVVGGRVVMYDNRRVLAYAASNGSSLWTANVAPQGEDGGETPGGGVASDGSRIYVATGLRVLAALDAGSGSAAWTVRLPEPARGAPTVAGGRIYVVTAGNAVYAFSTSDGKEIWRYSSVPEVGGLLLSSSPAVGGNTVVVPFSSGELVALDSAKGTQKWTGSLARAMRTQGVMSLSDIAGRPVIDRGVVFAGSVSGRLVAVKEATGDKIWEKNLSTAHAPAVSGEGVFVVTLSGEAYGLDRATGGVRWTLTLPSEGRTQWAGPLLAGNYLWFASNKGKLVSVDPRTGQLAGEREIGEGATIAPIAAGGRLFVPTIRGGIASFE